MPLLPGDDADPLVGVALWFGLAVVAFVFRRLARASQLGRRLDAAFSLIIVGLCVGGIGLATQLARIPGAAPYLDAVVFGALALGAVRAGLTLFVELYIRQRSSAALSSIFLDVASLFAYFVVIVVVLRSTLDINLASLVATSAVLTAIIGLALQDVLSNVFSGVVLELEQAFAPGDWVRVGTYQGRVVVTGWRTTRIRTSANELVTLPNSMLSKEAMVNHSRPDPVVADVVRFEAAYDVAPNLVKETVLTMLGAQLDVLRSPAPTVRLDRYGESGLQYSLHYCVADFGAHEGVRDRVLTNLWYALRRANVRVPFPTRELLVYPGDGAAHVAPEPDIHAALRAVALLEPLDSEALATLAAGVGRVTFGKDEVVIREGDVGDCFYIIERGQARVTVGGTRGVRSLGTLYAGSIFGEMSVLTGEPRVATVHAASDLSVLTVSRDLFQQVIANNPALLEPLSEIAARRLAALEEQVRRLDAPPAVDVERQQVQRLHERIKEFFGF